MSEDYGVYIDTASANSNHCVFKDILIENASTSGVYINSDTQAQNHTFLNATYTGATFSGSGAVSLVRKWYAEVTMQDDMIFKVS